MSFSIACHRLKGDDTPIGKACATMAKLAGSIDYGIIRNEYIELIHRRWKGVKCCLLRHII